MKHWNALRKSSVVGLSMLAAGMIGACGTPGSEFGPNVGQGASPRISPVNQASDGDIEVHLTTQTIVLDGNIDATEWQDADTIWFIGGENVKTVGYFMRNATHLLVAYFIPDESPEDREKLRFVVDVDNDGGGIDDVKSDDLQFYLQRGSVENFNPGTFFDNYAWDVFQGQGDAWVPLNRTMSFDFAVLSEDSLWAAELAIPLEHLNYAGESSREYRTMSFVANAGNGHGAWPVDTYIMQPDTWGRMIIHDQ